MSTKRDTKYIAKRRAMARKRNRDIIRYIGVYFFIAMLVIGTVSTVFIAQVGAPTTPVSTATATPQSNSGLSQLVTQADGNIASGDFTQGIGLYRAYLSQCEQPGGSCPDTADVHFKVGKAYLDSRNQTPDYVAGLDHLQRAININPVGSFVPEANALISQYASAANATAAVLASAVPLTGTATVTGTAAVTGTMVTGTSTITATTTVTNTGASGEVQPTVPVTVTTPITP